MHHLVFYLDQCVTHLSCCEIILFNSSLIFQNSNSLIPLSIASSIVFKTISALSCHYPTHSHAAVPITEKQTSYIFGTSSTDLTSTAQQTKKYSNPFHVPSCIMQRCDLTNTGQTDLLVFLSDLLFRLFFYFVYCS